MCHPSSTDSCSVRPGRYAIGMNQPGDTPPMFGSLTPISEIECVSLYAPWLDGGDGFVALRAGSVIALGASNAMKFEPLLGDRLACTAPDSSAVHADLSVTES